MAGAMGNDRRSRGGQDGESGQVLVLFAVAVAVIVGMLVLVIDLGLLLSQRRFDQNGADAAALAAGRRLAGEVTPLDEVGGIYISATDASLYQQVRQYAGLNDSTGLTPSAASSDSTGVNQNVGLTSRTKLAVTLEYSTAAGQWCYSPSGLEPPRSPAVPVCTLFARDGNTYPPLPTTNQFYRVRVTVSATTDGFFTRIRMPGSSADSNNNAPPVPTDQGSAACRRATGAAGNVTCAQSVVVVKGSPNLPPAADDVIPTATGSCQVVPNGASVLFELWGSSPNPCGSGIGSWKNLLDLSAEQKWCDNASGQPDYKYTKLMPPLALGYSTDCPSPGPVSDTWQRDGGRYVPDAARSGTGEADKDIPFWIARGFGGTLRADTCPTCADGVRLPSYENNQPASSPGGQNIALGFYCDGSVTTNTCPGNSPANTYFFAKNQPGFQNVCPDLYQSTGAGCRDSAVVLWTDKQQANGAGTGWEAATGAPDRLRIARILNFRIYCDHATPADTTTPCSSPPKSVVGSAANSTVWGRFVSPVGTIKDCTTCTIGPSINGNSATLES
jgi:hypothetical protein